MTTTIEPCMPKRLQRMLDAVRAMPSVPGNESMSAFEALWALWPHTLWEHTDVEYRMHRARIYVSRPGARLVEIICDVDGDYIVQGQRTGTFLKSNPHHVINICATTK